MKTTTKVYNQRIEDYILSCIESEDIELVTAKEKLTYFFSEFDRSANFTYNKKRLPNEQERIAEYISGLPFNFDYTNFDILEVAKKLHETGSFTESMEDKIIDNWWMHIAFKLMQLRKKYL